MRVRYTPQARTDINRIYAYLNKRSPSGAVNVSAAVYAGVRFIAERPEASERTDDPNVRVKVVRRYRYKIFYSIAGTPLKSFTSGTLPDAPGEGAIGTDCQRLVRRGLHLPLAAIVRISR
jgi:plasmid stabilization system protein ParE